MENKSSQIFGGERNLGVGEGIFSSEVRQEEETERFIPDNAKSMGEGALKGINELPMPEEPVDEDIKRVIQGGGVIAKDGESDTHTEKGVDEMVERAERSVAEAKREHNALKMQEEKIALGRETLEMMRGNGGVQ